MTTTRMTIVLCLLSACLALAACGDDDGTTTTTTPAGQVTEAPSANPTTKAAETATQASTREDPEATATPLEGLPSTTPEPGPPARFEIVVTDDAVEPSVRSLPEGPSLEATVINESSEAVPFNLVANGNVVGAGVVERGDQVAVQVRNLLRGKLKITSPPGRTAVVRVVGK